MNVVLFLYISKLSDTFWAFLNFLLLHLSELILNLFLFAPLSLLDVIDKWTFETELKYLRLCSDQMVKFKEIPFDRAPLLLVTLVYNVIEIGISIHLLYCHPSIFDDFRECQFRFGITWRCYSLKFVRWRVFIIFALFCLFWFTLFLLR